MVVFALVNNTNAGGYYIASDRTSMGWRGLPHDLAREMEDVRQKGEEVEEVSIGLDGDWFLRTNARHSCKIEYDQKNMASNVELFVHLIQQAGLSLAQYAIQFFTFVPDPTGYITVLHKTDGSLTRCAWHNIPRDLDMVLEREACNGVRHVAVGKNGAYVVLLNTGAMWWAGVPDPLQRLLDDAERKGREVVTVSLSLVSDSWYFVEFADGATKFFLPPAWHDSINKFTAQALRSKGPRISTSYNRVPSTSPLHHSPQQHRGQFGSFNPTSPYGLPNAGYTPFVGNPFLASAFTGMQPQPAYTPFVGNPYLASAFTGMLPQPAPVYNITHVYNSPVPQPHQQQQKSSTLQDYNGLFKLLGGALKLAGTVLGPTTLGTGGLGMGTGFGGFGGFGGF